MVISFSIARLTQGATIVQELSLQILATFSSEDTTRGGALDKAEAEKKRLIDVLDSVGVFVERGGEGINTSWAAAEAREEHLEIATIVLSETKSVDTEELARFVGERDRERAFVYLGEVANAL